MTAQVYVLETIYRSEPYDPLTPGSYRWPFVAADDDDAKAQADAMLADFLNPAFVASWHSGDAVRIQRGATEFTWRSLRGGKYANWT